MSAQIWAMKDQDSSEAIEPSYDYDHMTIRLEEKRREQFTFTPQTRPEGIEGGLDVYV